MVKCGCRSAQWCSRDQTSGRCPLAWHVLAFIVISAELAERFKHVETSKPDWKHWDKTNAQFSSFLGESYLLDWSIAAKHLKHWRNVQVFGLNCSVSTLSEKVIWWGDEFKFGVSIWRFVWLFWCLKWHSKALHHQSCGQMFKMTELWTNGVVRNV